MKLLLIICVVLGVTWVHGQRFSELSSLAQKLAGAQISNCKTQHGIDENVFEQIKQGNYGGSSNVPCFLQCALKGTRVLSGDGTISKQSVLNFKVHLGGEQQATNVYEECKKKEQGNSCESAKEIYDCFRSNNAGFL